MRGRNKVLLVAAVLAVVAVPLLLRDEPSADESPMAAAALGQLTPGASAPAATAPKHAARPTAAAPPRPVTPPVFDSVEVEKEEVCEGEENLVTVRAHTTDGND